MYEALRYGTDAALKHSTPNKFPIKHDTAAGTFYSIWQKQVSTQQPSWLGIYMQWLISKLLNKEASFGVGHIANMVGFFQAFSIQFQS